MKHIIVSCAFFMEFSVDDGDDGDKEDSEDERARAPRISASIGLRCRRGLDSFAST